MKLPGLLDEVTVRAPSPIEASIDIALHPQRQRGLTQAKCPLRLLFIVMDPISHVCFDLKRGDASLRSGGHDRQ